MAGGVNVYDGNISYPVLSAESILRLNPAVIIDIIPDMDTKDLDEEKILKKWGGLPGLDAVHNGRVHVFSDDYVGIPGPRFILILEHMARVIYPQAGWE
jgi:iron complex transport system substrate-binding protein